MKKDKTVTRTLTGGNGNAGICGDGLTFPTAFLAGETGLFRTGIQTGELVKAKNKATPRSEFESESIA